MQLNCTGSGVIRPRRQRLQGELAGEDVAAAVAPHVEDQTLLRQQLHQPDELVHEGGRVLHAEREDPQVPERARRR